MALTSEPGDYLTSLKINFTEAEIKISCTRDLHPLDVVLAIQAMCFGLCREMGIEYQEIVNVAKKAENTTQQSVVRAGDN